MGFGTWLGSTNCLDLVPPMSDFSPFSVVDNVSAYLVVACFQLPCRVPVLTVVSMASAPSPVTPCSLTLFVFPSRTSSHTHTASPSLPPSLPVSLPLSRSLPSLPLSRSLPSLPLIFKLKLIYKTSKTGLPIIWSIRLSKLMHI